MGKREEPDSVLEPEVGRMQLCHVVEEPAVLRDRDPSGPSRHQLTGHVAHEHGGAPVTPFRHVRRAGDHGVIDDRRQGIERGRGEQRELTAVQVTGGAHDPVVVDAEVLHHEGLGIDGGALEPTARQRVRGFPWLAVLRVTEQVCNGGLDPHR